MCGLTGSFTYHFLTDDLLQTADDTNKKAVLWQENRTYDAVVKLDTTGIEIYRGIARFSLR